MLPIQIIRTENEIHNTNVRKREETSGEKQQNKNNKNTFHVFLPCSKLYGKNGLTESRTANKQTNKQKTLKFENSRLGFIGTVYNTADCINCPTSGPYQSGIITILTFNLNVPFVVRRVLGIPVDD